MKFVWNNEDADIGYYECALLDDDGSKLQEINFTDNTNYWKKEDDARNGFKRAYSFEVNYCRGYSMREGFDYDEEYRNRPSGGYQGVCTHTVEDIKHWCEEYLAQKYIDHYKEMLAELNTAKRRAMSLKNMGYGNDKENKTSDNQEKRFWETDMELSFGFGNAPAADLIKLPVGTTFHVVNGEWDGEIVEKDGKKAIHIFEEDTIYPISETDRYGLALSNVVLPQEQKTSKEDEDERDSKEPDTSDVEVLIMIPKWKYQSICEGIEASKRCGVVGIDHDIHEAIYNGTPLPKGHGKIGDLDAVMSDICASINGMTNAGIMVDGEYLWGKLNDAIDNAQPIIKADDKNEEKSATSYDSNEEDMEI